MIWDCNGQANQQCRLNADGTITAVGANKCLDVRSGTANGTKARHLELQRRSQPALDPRLTVARRVGAPLWRCTHVSDVGH